MVYWFNKIFVIYIVKMSQKMPDILPPCERIIVIGDLNGDLESNKRNFSKVN